MKKAKLHNQSFRNFPQTLRFLLSFSAKSTPHPSLEFEIETETERIAKIINDHQFNDPPLSATLHQISTLPDLLSTGLVENVLGRLFAAHANGLKAFEFFKFALNYPQFRPSPSAFEKTLHILARMRYFEKAWELMEDIRRMHPSLLTLKSMSILLSRIAKFESYEETLQAFERLEKEIFVERQFGSDEFNVLLRAFCTQRQMKEAKSVFNKMRSRFLADTKTMNILLLGFKESGNVTAVELFYHEMLRRGFKPNTITYNIRIDAYCKKGCFGDALRLFEDMEQLNCLPTLQVITTLIHGAGVARNLSKAQNLFNEIAKRNIKPDIGAYNALLSALIRCRDVESAISLMNEMEEKGIGHDGVSYHTMFVGLMKSRRGILGVCELYQRMAKRNFVPKTRTTVMLMKLFCENGLVDLGLDLWEYLIEKGYCPHGQALDLLVTGLCSRGRVNAAFECSKQMLERGRHVSESSFLMLQRLLKQAGYPEKLKNLDLLIKRLHDILPPTRGHGVGLPASM